MERSRESRRRPRRPGRESGRDGADPKERMDREFSREIEMRIGYFLQSAEEELELEPMNSYRRRLVHNIAKNFRLHSESRGEDRDRYVCLIKTQETEADPPSRVRLWDYGTQIFNVSPGENGIRMALKIDGSVEIWREENKKEIIADRLITTNEFRIRRGQLLVPDDPGY